MLCRKSNNICGSSIRLIVTYRLAPLGPISARLGDVMQQPMMAGRFSCLDTRVVQRRHQRENPWHSLSQCYPHKREGQLLLELTDGDYSSWQQQRPGLMTLGLGSYGAPQYQMHTGCPGFLTLAAPKWCYKRPRFPIKPRWLVEDLYSIYSTKKVKKSVNFRHLSSSFC